jgi:hypothetical protein
MSAIVQVLTPASIDTEDYPLVQKPALGGEKKVHLTTKLARVLGFIFLKDDASVQYTFENTPVTGGGPIVCFVQDELRSAAAAVVTYGDLTATFEPADYARNQSFDFGCGRGAELAGPNVVAITASTVPTITGAKKGSKLILVQLPTLDDFVEIGCTRGKDLTIPAKHGKLIGDNLEANRYSKKGMTRAPSLKITAYDKTPDDGFARFAGQTCVAMLETLKEDKILCAREFCIDYVPGRDEKNPEADGESTVDAEGSYQYFISLVAPGS